MIRKCSYQYHRLALLSLHGTTWCSRRCLPKTKKQAQEATVLTIDYSLLCDHPSCQAKLVTEEGWSLVRGNIYTKMWGLVPDFAGLITGEIAGQRGHITGGPLYHGLTCSHAVWIESHLLWVWLCYMLFKYIRVQICMCKSSQLQACCLETILMWNVTCTKSTAWHHYLH